MNQIARGRILKIKYDRNFIEGQIGQPNRHINHTKITEINYQKMETQRGFPLLWQQYKALLFKNLLLSWRNKRSTFLQLFSSLFFIALIFFIQEATDARYASSSSFRNNDDPKPLVAPPIPPCEDKYYAKMPCFDFVWSGSDSSRIQEIVRRIRANNPGRPIPEGKVCV